MNYLSQNNIESELSYAYLHAIASKAGMNCQILNRHSDNDGVDVMVEFKGIIPGTYITHVSFHVQLKATYTHTVRTNDISYTFSGIDQYNKLRTPPQQIPRFLMLLCLPTSPDEWLTCSPDKLILKEAMYWLCLHGAAETNNTSSVTLYFPKVNLLTPECLRDLAMNY